jgi:membrane protein
MRSTLRVSLAAAALLFALILRYVPETKRLNRRLGPAPALLFTIGKLLMGLYLAKAAVGSSYGAAGSMVVIVVWVYYQR